MFLNPWWIICLVLCANAQSLNLGSLVSAGESLYNSVVASDGDNVGALATAAGSALSGIVASASPTQPSDSARSSSPSVTPSSTSSGESSSSQLPSSSSSTASTTSMSTSQPSSTATLSTSPSTSSPSPVDAGTTPSASQTPDDAQAQHHKDQLLEIILPTVLSGLTLLLLLLAILWYCSRQRRRRRHRESGLERLYGAGSVSHHPDEMEERVDHGLLGHQHRTSLPPHAIHEEHTAYEPHNSIPMPAHSMLRPSPRHSPPNNHNRWTVPPSRFSTSTSTNGASVAAVSHSSGEPATNREIRKSYQPVVSEEPPAELETGVPYHHHHHPAESTEPSKDVARAHTPPLQAIFPWFGGGPSVPRRSSKRQSGSKVHYPSREEAGGFTFGFPAHRAHHDALYGPANGKRFSIPRKPVPAQQQGLLT